MALAAHPIEATLEVEAAFLPVTLTVPYARTDLVDRFHRAGRVEELRHTEDGTVVTGWLPSADISRFAPYVAVRGGADGRDQAPVEQRTPRPGAVA